MKKETMNRREFLEKLSIASIAFMIGCTEPNPKVIPKPTETPILTHDDKEVARIRQEDTLMTNEAAETYVKERIHPRLDKLLADPRTPIGVTRRISELFAMIGRKEIDYFTLPAFHPRSKDLIAKMDYDDIKDKAMLVVFVPALQKHLEQLQKENLSEDEQTLDIGMLYAHEYIHHEQEVRNPMNKELAGKVGDSRSLDIEAEAWGLTVTEMVRPAMKNGMHVAETFSSASEHFEKLGDNWQDPRWKILFGYSMQK